MPRGFPKPGKVLKLKKSLYGLKQAPRIWFNHLKDKLELLGFVQCVDVDQCLFFFENVILLYYVDDCLLYAKDPEDIQEVIRQLHAQNMQLKEEGTAEGFLGVTQQSGWHNHFDPIRSHGSNHQGSRLC